MKTRNEMLARFAAPGAGGSCASAGDAQTVTHARPVGNRRPGGRRIAAGAVLLLVLTPAPASETVVDEQAFFEKKCGLCHTSQRIFLTALSPEQRRHIVMRMRDRWEGGQSWLSDEDIERILDYVEVESDKPLKKPEQALEAKELFRQRCAGCHELDRVYREVKTERGKPAAWMHVVTRMRAKAPEWISEEEAKRIVDYLRERTVPKSTP